MAAGDHRRDVKSNRKPATALARGGTTILTPKEATTTTASPSSQGFGILRKRKEAMAAQDLWELEDVPGGMDTWTDRWLEMKAKIDDEDAARPVAKKTKRVVKQRMPKELIEHLVATPFRNVDELSPDQLAKRSREYREVYAMTMFVDGKMRDYEQALIDQYKAQGMRRMNVRSVTTKRRMSRWRTRAQSK